MAKIDILLAAYNGAPYLCAQIDSLLRQDYPHWRLLIRDDGSTDDTRALAQSYAVQYPDKIQLLPMGGNLGASGNFAALLATSTAEYAMFCDQDDVWHPQKISVSLKEMQALEAQHGKDTPLLVHADARIVDSNLHLLHPSFAAYERLQPEHATLARLLVQNAAQGCAMLLNRALARLASPIPAEARMHDMWVALIAAACGYIAYIPEPLLDYRQHANNAIGTPGANMEKIKGRIRQMMQDNLAQAHALHARCAAHMPADSRTIVESFLALPALPWGLRQLRLLTGGYLRHPLHENLAVLWHY